LSYILDALKKADAERERAAVPGLHAHPQDGLASSERRLLWPVLAVAAIALLGAALVYLLLSERGVRTPPLVATAQPQPVPAPAPAPAAAPAPSVAEPPPVVAEPLPTPVVVRPPPAPPPAPTATPAPAPATAAAPARVPALAELAPELRAGLPALSIGGAVYSPTPSARLLFVNGQVLREGDAMADGVKVEAIGAASSVLSVRGQRFEVKH
jgi:general secretion pathway protein B